MNTRCRSVLVWGLPLLLALVYEIVQRDNYVVRLR
jgi:hypothetical protein